MRLFEVLLVNIGLLYATHSIACGRASSKTEAEEEEEKANKFIGDVCNSHLGISKPLIPIWNEKYVACKATVKEILEKVEGSTLIKIIELVEDLNVIKRVANIFFEASWTTDEADTVLTQLISVKTFAQSKEYIGCRVETIENIVSYANAEWWMKFLDPSFKKTFYTLGALPHMFDTDYRHFEQYYRWWDRRRADDHRVGCTYVLVRHVISFSERRQRSGISTPGLVDAIYDVTCNPTYRWTSHFYTGIFLGDHMYKYPVPAIQTVLKHSSRMIVTCIPISKRMAWSTDSMWSQLKNCESERAGAKEVEVNVECLVEQMKGMTGACAIMLGPSLFQTVLENSSDRRAMLRIMDFTSTVLRVKLCKPEERQWRSLQPRRLDAGRSTVCETDETVVAFFAACHRLLAETEAERRPEAEAAVEAAIHAGWSRRWRLADVAAFLEQWRPPPAVLPFKQVASFFMVAVEHDFNQVKQIYRLFVDLNIVVDWNELAYKDLTPKLKLHQMARLFEASKKASSVAPAAKANAGGGGYKTRMEPDDDEEVDEAEVDRPKEAFAAKAIRYYFGWRDLRFFAAVILRKMIVYDQALPGDGLSKDQYEKFFSLIPSSDSIVGEIRYFKDVFKNAAKNKSPADAVASLIASGRSSD